MSVLLRLRLGSELRLVTVEAELLEALRDQPGIRKAWVVRWQR